jgi:hypothetical protein
MYIYIYIYKQTQTHTPIYIYVYIHIGGGENVEFIGKVIGRVGIGWVGGRWGAWIPYEDRHAVVPLC